MHALRALLGSVYYHIINISVINMSVIDMSIINMCIINMKFPLQ